MGQEFLDAAGRLRRQAVENVLQVRASLLR